MSPGVLSFKDVLRDGYAESVVVITTDSPEPIFGRREFIGDYEDWFRFEPAEETFNLSRNRSFSQKIIVTPPPDVANGAYTTYVRFMTSPLGSPSTAMGASVQQAVMLRITVSITGREIVSCVVGAVQIPLNEENYPLQVQASVLNKGNVNVVPEFTVDVWDQYQENLVVTHTFRGPNVLPTTVKKFSAEWDASLKPGQYWAYVTAKPCGYSSLLTFDVAEKGEIVDRGVLGFVSSKAWAFVNETVPITARFRNLGERFVSAKFKGTVSLEGSIVSLLESDELRVEPGEEVDLVTFFTPKKPGKYEVSGKVLYNKKITFEKGTIINVNTRAYPRLITRYNFLPVLLYVIILGVVVFLILRIRRERKRRR